MHNLEFKLQISKHYLSLLTLVLVGSCLIIICLTLAIWLKLLGVAMVLIYGKWIIWQFGLLRSPHAILSMQRQADSQWLLRTRKASMVAKLRGDSTVTGFVSVLRFDLAEKRWPISCVICRDSFALADHYHQLLVTVRMLGV